MKNLFILLLLSCCFGNTLKAQEGVTQWGQPTGQEKFPLNNYVELPNWEKKDAKSWSKIKNIKAGWGSIDVRYHAASTPLASLSSSQHLVGWRGERVYAQAVVYTPHATTLSYQISDFKNGKHTIDASNFTIGFTRSVISDKESVRCDKRTDNSKIDSIFVPDPIDHINKSLNLQAQTGQGIWVTCWIPNDAKVGTYRGTLDIYAGDKLIKRLPLSITAKKHILPAPQAWKYHLDLWQNPFAIARYHQVEPWSNEHFAAMRPIMQRLSDAGQKTITTTITHRPWDGQTEDAFSTMVTWIKKADGTWMFDYTVFDMWVEFMMSVGIDGYISCYSLLPWTESINYFDQAENKMKTFEVNLSDNSFETIWTPMLRSFANHLDRKGWLERCLISMDEQPVESMKRVISFIHEIEPRFKLSLAGHHYNDEIGPELLDFSCAWISSIPAEVTKQRNNEGKVSTYYTCCSEKYPNTLTFSYPAEAAWISGRVAKEHLTGYLRWAYNSWTLEPLLDSRFKSWASGDTYIVYPGNRSSIRFERLVDGIQLCEKVTILRELYKNEPKQLDRIERILSPFDVKNLTSGADAANMIRKAKIEINKF